MRLTRKLRFLFVYPIVGWLLFAAHMTERHLHVGLALIALGEGVRLWANGYVGHVKVNRTQQERGDPKIGSLVTAGPYAFVRHPLYLGTFLIGAGFCVIGGSLWVSAAALGGFLVVYRRKMAQEEALLRREVGTPYLVYQGAVARWLPGRERYPIRQGWWSWRGLAASKEWKTVIWVLVVIIVLYFREEIMIEREFLPMDEFGEWIKHASLLTAMLVLMLADGAFEMRARRRALPATG